MDALLTPSLVAIGDDWNSLTSKRQATNRDKNLSLVGKREALSRIEAQRDALRSRTVEAVQAADAALRTSYQAYKKARGKALDASRGRWPETLNGRIAEETERARLLIQRGNEFEIRQAWESVKDSTAFCYAWYLAVRDNVNAGPVRVDVMSEWDAIENTIPEFEAARRQGVEVTRRGTLLERDIKTILNSTDWGSLSFDSRTSELQNILARLRVAHGVEDGQEVVTFEYVENAMDLVPQPYPETFQVIEKPAR